MYGFLIAVGILLLISIIWMVYRIQTLVSVVKGSDKKVASGSNKVNAMMFVLFLVGNWWIDVLVFHQGI
jgi:cytochrome c oxidase subunit II